MHNRRKPFKCTECNYRFTHKGTLKNHLLIHNKKFKCSECSFTSRYKGSLKRHSLSHDSNKLPKDTDCKGVIKEEETLPHNTIDLPKCSEFSYDCKEKSECGTNVESSSSEETSLMKTAVEVDAAKRLKCNAVTNDSKDAVTNESKDAVTNDSVMQKPVKLLKCLHCKFESNYKSFLKRHMFSHVKKKDGKNKLNETKIEESDRILGAKCVFQSLDLNFAFISYENVKTTNVNSNKYTVKKYGMNSTKVKDPFYFISGRSYHDFDLRQK
ncbi:Zinc finger protein 91 [Armadillidium vulgare]|nr:Zinc finger protein 91 [Armadillidium vulgare]